MARDTDDPSNPGHDDNPPEGAEFEGAEPPLPCGSCAADGIAGGEWDGNHLEKIYAVCSGDIYRYCYRRLGNHEDAMDATSQTFAQAITYRASYDPAKATGGARSYLYGIAKQVCDDMLDKRRPLTLKIRCAETVTLVVGEPFVFDFLVSPHESICTLVDAPDWLKLGQLKKATAARRRIEGTAPQAGKWTFQIAAEHWKKSFSRQVTFRALSQAEAKATTLEPPVDPSKARATGLRAEHEAFDDAAHSSGSFNQSPGLREHVEWLLSHLTADQRPIVEMRILQEKTPEEIAELTGLRPNTISQMVRRALDHLRSIQGDEDHRAGGQGSVR